MCCKYTEVVYICNMDNINFLPTGYEVPKGAGGNYLKLEQGETRFRIISNPIVGTLYWVDEPGGGRKPLRYQEAPKQAPANAKDKPKHFWAMAVLHKGEVKIFEVTQKALLNALKNLASNPEWGHPSQYDVIVTRTGSGMDSEYSLTPCPKKALGAADIKTAQGTQVELDRLYDGENPFEVAGMATAYFL